MKRRSFSLPSQIQPNHLFYLGTAIFLLIHLWMALAPHLLREIPFEPDDHYHTYLKSSHLNNCRDQPCPGLKDMYQQIQESSDPYQANRRTHSLFYSYQPLYTLLVAGLIRAGFTYDNVQFFLSATGTFIVTLSVALFLRAVFGAGAAGITLLLIAPILFPAWGLAYIVPITLCISLFFLAVSALCLPYWWKWPLALLALAGSIGFHMVGILLSGLALLMSVLMEKNWKQPALFLFAIALGLVCIGSQMFKLSFIDQPIHFFSMFASTNWPYILKRNLNTLIEWLMFHQEFFGITMMALVLLTTLPGANKKHPFSHILTLWAILACVILYWVVRLLFETNNIFNISKPVLFIGWLMPVGYLVLLVVKHPLAPTMPQPRRLIQWLALLFLLALIGSLFFPKPDIALISRLGIVLSVFAAGLYGVCTCWVLSHTFPEWFPGDQIMAPGEERGPWETRLIQWAVITILGGSLLIHYAYAIREINRHNQHIIFTRTDELLDAGQVRTLLQKAKPEEKVLYHVRDETFFYYLLYGSARLGIVDWSLPQDNTSWLQPDVKFLVSINPIARILVKDIVLQKNDRLIVRPRDADAGANLNIAVRGAGYGGVLKITGTTDQEQSHTLGFKEEKRLPLPVRDIDAGLTLTASQGAVRLTGVRTEDNGLYWPWNDDVTLELIRPGIDNVTIRFDPKKLSPTPLCQVGAILQDRGSSVLSSLECTASPAP